MVVNGYVSGWWLTYPSEKYESQLGLLFPLYGKIKKNVPNFQTTRWGNPGWLSWFITGLAMVYGRYNYVSWGF